MAKPSSSSGKLIDTWYYEYKGIPSDQEGGEPSVQPIKVPIYLRLNKKLNTDTAPPMSVREVSFELECKQPEFRFRGPNIEALRARMWAELDPHFAVKWENWFLVQIRRERTYDGAMGTGFTFSYKQIQKGIAWDGTELMREYHRFGREEQITPWPEVFRDNRGDIIACIEATDEHEKALENFSNSIDELRRKLAGFLKPEIILQTLLGGSGMSLLPTPPAEAEEHDAGVEP
jgi:hypothetical protein